MPDTLPIDLGRYSVFVPPDPFEDHVGPFYFRIAGDARQAGSVHCVLPTHARHGNYAGGVHGGTTLAFADYALCLVAGRAADGGTNSSFAMTVSIAVEFLDAGRIGPPLEASGEPLQVTGPPRLRARQHHPGRPHHRAVVGRVPPRGARQGDGAQGGVVAVCGDERRPAERAGGFRAFGQCQRLFAPHRPVLRAQGEGRRLADPADPAAHVQLRRRAAWRLHDELRRFGGDPRGRASSPAWRRARWPSPPNSWPPAMPRRRSPPGSRCRATASRWPSCAACWSRTAGRCCPIRRPSSCGRGRFVLGSARHAPARHPSIR